MLVCLLTVTVFFVLREKNTIPLTVRITGDSVTKTIRPWYDDAGKWYFFLPSYAAEENSVLCCGGTGYTLQGTPLSGGESPLSFETGKEYRLERRGLLSDLNTTVVFLRSENVASMYIDTQSGSMTKIHRNKDNKEHINIAIYGENGQLMYCADRYADTISGHGNTTWGISKKPYNIELSSPSGLLGMPEACKWVLLANAIDETNLRNKIVLDAAERAGLQWTPECEYLDLFINGEYTGLYLLTEKIETGTNKVNTDPQSGVLVSQTYAGRRKGAFRLESGRVFYAVSPKTLSDTEKDKVIGHMQDAENAIAAQDWEEYIDGESWAKKSLLEECFGNGDIASLYMYWDDTDERIHAGPAWDYDNAIGNTFWVSVHVINPHSFSIGIVPNGKTDQKSWACLLYRSESFRELCRQEYADTLGPILEALISGGIERQYDAIRIASELNSLRWKRMFEKEPVRTDVDDILAYLTERHRFLTELLIENRQFVTVEFGDYKPFFVEKGSAFGKIPAAELFSLPEDTVWLDAEDGTEFDPESPLFENVRLIPRYSADGSSAAKSGDNLSKPSGLEGMLKRWLPRFESGTAAVLLCALLAVFGFAFVCVDGRRNGKGRNG